MSNVLVYLPGDIGSCILSDWIIFDDIVQLETAYCQHQNDLRNQFLALVKSFSTSIRLGSSVTNKRSAFLAKQYSWAISRGVKIFNLYVLDQFLLEYDEVYSRLDLGQTNTVIIYCRNNLTNVNAVRLLNRCHNLKELTFWSGSSTISGLGNSVLKQLCELDCNGSCEFSCTLLAFAAECCQFLKVVKLSTDDERYPSKQKFKESDLNAFMILLLQRNALTLTHINITANHNINYNLQHKYVECIASNKGNKLTYVSIDMIKHFVVSDIVKILQYHKCMKLLDLSDARNYTGGLTYRCDDHNNVNMDLGNRKAHFHPNDLAELFGTSTVEFQTLSMRTNFNAPMVSTLISRCANTLTKMELHNEGLSVTGDDLRLLVSSCLLLKVVELRNFEHLSCHDFVNLFKHKNIIERLCLASHTTLNTSAVLKIVRECVQLSILKMYDCINVDHAVVKTKLCRLANHGGRKRVVSYNSEFEYVMDGHVLLYADLN